MNQAPSSSSTMSVTSVPPLGWYRAAAAGTMAIRTGLDCHHVVSSEGVSPAMSWLLLARRRLSREADGLRAGRESLEFRELRRRGTLGEDGRAASAKVDARLSIRWRNWDVVGELGAWLSAVAWSMVRKRRCKYALNQAGTVAGGDGA